MRRKNYNLPPTYSLGPPGNACFLEPPGHPRYFVRCIYTRHGNSPRKGPGYFLDGDAFDKLEEIDSLFKTLPYDHPRVRAWETHAYAYFKNSYSPDGKTRDVSKAVSSGHHNGHLAFLLVRNHYPRAAPRADLIIDPPLWGRGGEGTWWERLDKRPSPDECPGDKLGRHPVNVSWCQVCGWIA